MKVFFCILLALTFLACSPTESITPQSDLLGVWVQGPGLTPLVITQSPVEDNAVYLKYANIHNVNDEFDVFAAKVTKQGFEFYYSVGTIIAPETKTAYGVLQGGKLTISGYDKYKRFNGTYTRE